MNRIQKELETYRSLTKQSAEMSQQARQIMPGGISHEVRLHAPYPPVIHRSQGPYLYDVDENEYVDFWMGHYSHILGHNPDIVRRAITGQLDHGIMWGALNDLEIELGLLLQELVPSLEKLRFCTTGTEATMYAVRLARGFTGRNLVLKMEGGWHGPSSELFHGVTGEFERSESLGITTSGKDIIGTLPYNDIAGCERFLDKIDTSELAAIIVEPMLGSSFFIPASKEFLGFLRTICDETGAMLIFDEIITGFRLSLHGGQGYYGIRPDLTTLGKISGGGFPMAIVGGNEEIMSSCDPTRGLPKWKRVRIGGGTFSCHPMAMISSRAVLSYLRDNEEQVYSHLATSGKDIRRESERIFTEQGIPVSATGVGSLFNLHFHKEVSSPPTGPRQSIEDCYYPFREKVFKLMMLNRGIFLMHGGGAISMSHGPKEIERYYSALRDIAEILSHDKRLFQQGDELIIDD